MSGSEEILLYAPPVFPGLTPAVANQRAVTPHVSFRALDTDTKKMGVAGDVARMYDPRQLPPFSGTGTPFLA